MSFTLYLSLFYTALPRPPSPAVVCLSVVWTGHRPRPIEAQLIGMSICQRVGGPSIWARDGYLECFIQAGWNAALSPTIHSITHSFVQAITFFEINNRQGRAGMADGRSRSVDRRPRKGRLDRWRNRLRQGLRWVGGRTDKQQIGQAAAQEKVAVDQSITPTRRFICMYVCMYGYLYVCM